MQHHTPPAEKSSVLTWLGRQSERRGNAKAVFTFSQTRERKSQELAKIQLSKFHPNILEMYSLVFLSQTLRSYEVWRLPSFFSLSHPPFLLQSGVSLKIAEVDFGIYKIELSLILFPK